MSAVSMYKKRVMEAMKAGDLNALKTIATEIEEDKKHLDEVTDKIRGLMVQLRYFATGEEARAAEPKPEPVAAPEPVALPEPVAVPEPVAISEPVAAPVPVVAPAPEPVAAPEPLLVPEPEDDDDLDLAIDLDSMLTPAAPEEPAGDFDFSFLGDPTADPAEAKDDEPFDLSFDA